MIKLEVTKTLTALGYSILETIFSWNIYLKMKILLRSSQILLQIIAKRIVANIR